MAQKGNTTSIEPSMIARASQAVRYVISGVMPNDWFGPQQPLQPFAPPDVKGRAFDYPTGYNLRTTKRQGEPVSFDTLRQMADALPVLRAVIETRKDQISGLEWSIKPKDMKYSQKLTNENINRIKPITEFFSFPDRVNPFSAWLRCLLEDMFVIDAVTIYPRFAQNGGLYSLDIIDGSTITRLIDDGGRIPEAPDPAYQQILHGVPAGNFTRDELIYLPRNIRPHKLYGFSHVEQILLTINIALQRELHTAEFYRSGTTIPGFVTMPREDWTANEIEGLQMYFDSLMEGNSANRQKLKFMNSDLKYVPLGQQPLKDAYDEWLARVICYTFSLPPTAFTNQNNRATAETQQNSAISEGLVPLKIWIKNFMTSIIGRYFGEFDLEFTWVDTQDDNERARAADVADVKAGILSIDEVRHRRGEDPIGVENAIQTASGLIPVKKAYDTALLERVEENPKAGVNDQPTKDPESDNTAAKIDGLFNKVAKAKTVQVKTPSLDRSIAILAQERLAKAAAKTLSSVGNSIAHEVVTNLKILNKDGPSSHTSEDERGSSQLTDEQASDIADKFVSALDLAGFMVLIQAVFSELRVISVDSVAYTLKPLLEDLTITLGADAQQQLVGVVNKKAIEWAKDRAAELVGMGYNQEGALVANEAAKMNIVDTTKAMIKNLIVDGLQQNIGRQAIADNIVSSLAFSAERALLIAETEIARANEYSSLLSMLTISKSAGLDTEKSWSTAKDEKVCADICAANEAEGKISINDDFQSGDPCAPAHPRCRCATYYYQLIKRTDQNG